MCNNSMSETIETSKMHTSKKKKKKEKSNDNNHCTR